jgi:hypothetical protein
VVVVALRIPVLLERRQLQAARQDTGEARGAVEGMAAVNQRSSSTTRSASRRRAAQRKPLAHIPESDAVSQSLSHECDPPTGHLDMQHLAGTSLRTRTPPGTDWLGLCGGSALHEAALVGDARRRALQLQQQAGVLDLHQRVHVRQPRLPPTPPTPSPKHSATSHLAYIPSCTVFPPTHGLSGGGWGCDLPPSTH